MQSRSSLSDGITPLGDIGLDLNFPLRSVSISYLQALLVRGPRPCAKPSGTGARLAHLDSLIHDRCIACVRMRMWTICCANTCVDESLNFIVRTCGRNVAVAFVKSMALHVWEVRQIHISPCLMSDVRCAIFYVLLQHVTMFENGKIYSNAKIKIIYYNSSFILRVSPGCLIGKTNTYEFQSTWNCRQERNAK